MNKAKIRTYQKDRLGKAYCRLNCFKWDLIFGKAPDNWQRMSNKEKYHDPVFKQAWDILKESLTEKEKSMYWWTIELKRTKEEWLCWWNGRKYHGEG